MDSEATKKGLECGLSTATRLCPSAPGCRFGYPGIRDSSNSNRKPVAPILIRRGNDATALRLNNSFAGNPRVAEAANPWALGRNRVGVKSQGKAKDRLCAISPNGRRSFMIMADQLASDARTAIFNSIRAHLAESALHERAAEDREYERVAIGPGDRPSSIALASSGPEVALSPVEMFRERLEMVGGHCIVVQDEAEAVRSLSRILAELQTTPLQARRIALSDAPSVSRLMRAVEVVVEELTRSPNAADLFGYDVGVTTA